MFQDGGEFLSRLDGLITAWWSQGVKMTQQELQGLSRPSLRISHNLTPATFHWSKQMIDFTRLCLWSHRQEVRLLCQGRHNCCVRAGITVENDPWQPGLAAGALQPLPIHPSWKWLRGPTGTWQALLHSECPACAPVHSSPPRVVWGALCLYPKSLLGQSLVVVPLWWSARDGQFQFDAEWDGNFREGSELV